MKKLLYFSICAVGVLLPWRLRNLFAVTLNAIFQTLYRLYFNIVRYILRSLKKDDNDHK